MATQTASSQTIFLDKIKEALSGEMSTFQAKFATKMLMKRDDDDMLLTLARIADSEDPRIEGVITPQGAQKTKLINIIIPHARSLQRLLVGEARDFIGEARQLLERYFVQIKEAYQTAIFRNMEQYETRLEFQENEQKKELRQARVAHKVKINALILKFKHETERLRAKIEAELNDKYRALYESILAAERAKTEAAMQELARLLAEFHDFKLLHEDSQRKLTAELMGMKEERDNARRETREMKHRIEDMKAEMSQLNSHIRELNHKIENPPPPVPKQTKSFGMIVDFTDETKLKIEIERLRAVLRVLGFSDDLDTALKEAEALNAFRVRALAIETELRITSAQLLKNIKELKEKGILLEEARLLARNLTEQIKRISQELIKANANTQALEEELARKKKELDEITTKMVELKKVITENPITRMLQRQLDEVTAELENARNEIARLKEIIQQARLDVINKEDLLGRVFSQQSPAVTSTDDLHLSDGAPLPSPHSTPGSARRRLALVHMSNPQTPGGDGGPRRVRIGSLFVNPSATPGTSDNEPPMTPSKQQRADGLLIRSTTSLGEAATGEGKRSGGLPTRPFSAPSNRRVGLKLGSPRNGTPRNQNEKKWERLRLPLGRPEDFPNSSDDDSLSGSFVDDPSDGLKEKEQNSSDFSSNPSPKGSSTTRLEITGPSPATEHPSSPFNGSIRPALKSPRRFSASSSNDGELGRMKPSDIPLKHPTSPRVLISIPAQRGDNENGSESSGSGMAAKRKAIPRLDLAYLELDKGPELTPVPLPSVSDNERESENARDDVVVEGTLSGWESNPSQGPIVKIQVQMPSVSMQRETKKQRPMSAGGWRSARVVVDSASGRDPLQSTSKTLQHSASSHNGKSGSLSARPYSAGAKRTVADQSIPTERPPPTAPRPPPQPASEKPPQFRSSAFGSSSARPILETPATARVQTLCLHVQTDPSAPTPRSKIRPQSARLPTSTQQPTSARTAKDRAQSSLGAHALSAAPRSGSPTNISKKYINLFDHGCFQHVTS